MKRILTLLAFALFTSSIWAQVPQKMSYQAVIRNSSNVLVSNTTVGVKISVVQGTATGTAVYVETHSTSTNANALVSLQIGGGSVLSGSFVAINWANGPYFIKTETDPAGGTNYSISGTTELLSVPYALSAGQSSPAPGNAVGDMQYWNGTAWVLLPIGGTGQVLKVNNNIPQWTAPTQGVLSTVTTDVVTDIKAKQATLTGTVTNDGGEFVLTRGFCFSTTPTPTVTNGATTTGNGLGTFTADITSLTVSTTYYVRAFATTTAGTAYGNTLTFTTTNGIAAITTNPVTDMAQCYINCGGTVTTDGGDSLTNSGICYSTATNPTIADNPQGSGGAYDFTLSLTASAPNTVYYYRAYATNSTGTFYGAVLSFTSPNFVANVSTNTATLVKSCSATLNMSYTELMPNAAAIYGICYSTSPLPTVANGIDYTLTSPTLNADLTCLQPNTTYYARAYVYNYCYDYKYGNQITFTTTNNAITVTTNSPTSIGSCSIDIPYNTINTGDGSCGGTMNGVVYSTSPNPTTDDTTGNNFTNYIYINGLNANTSYYIRGYTLKCDGIAVYGNQIQVTTLPKYTSIVTNPATDITAGTAILNASIIANGHDYIYYGICYSTSPNPTVANTSIYYSATYDATTFARPIQGLSAGTTYYARVFVHDTNNNCIGINYGNQVSFTTAAGPLVVGQFYDGGIIIKLNTATTGIIAALSDQGTAAWGCEGTSIAGTLATQGSGQANTNAILAGCTTAGIAAKLCDALLLNSKTDWYLPSEQELILVGQLTYFSNNNYEINGGNSFSYWSSTQSSATQAKIVNEVTSGSVNKSDSSIRVRAVRSF
jgi:hypothetical protein